MLFLKYLLGCILIYVSFDSCYSFALPEKNAQSSLNELENYIQEHRQSVNPRYRQKFHISAPVGWINDPNGFSYFNNEYHMFYQYHPYSPYWGPMHWGHVKSKNLVDWEYVPTALIPGDEVDRNGCFSGSAIDNDGELTLVYTGNIDDPVRGNIQYQNIATSRDGITFEKYEGNPVIEDAPDGMRDFRDPKVWKHNDDFYMVVGNRSPSGRGRVPLYKSKDLIEWEYLGVLAEANEFNQGFMWECPDFFELDGKFVLIISPQGIEQSGDRYKNFWQTGYFVGTFDYETHIFNIESQVFEELDFGHDFYAAQTTATPDGRVVIIGWLGMWESEFKEQPDNWAGTLTIARELSLAPNGRLLMKPVRELETLRDSLVFSGYLLPGITIQYDTNRIELVATVIAYSSYVAGLDFFISDTEKVQLSYNLLEGTLVLDRGGGDFGIRRVPWRPNGPASWRIFLDSSSIEVFTEDGEVVFTTRIYPSQPARIQAFGGSIDVDIYSLRQSVDD